ncbi:MAG: FG-GAP-like repeat-containing protein [Pseudomonadota bacterium]
MILLMAPGAQAVELRGFPVAMGGRVSGSSPAVIDVDGDGQLDIALCTSTRLVVLDNSGAPLAGFPFALSRSADDSEIQNPASPTACDVDGDGRPELVVAGPDRKLHLVDGAGSERPGWPIELSARAPAAAACVDLDGDGKPEILVVSEDGILHARSASGAAAAGFHPPQTKFSPGLISVVDLVADRKGPELVLGTSDGRLHALERSGRSIEGFPVVTDYAVSAGASAGDLDGDGSWDLVFGSQDFGLYAVDARGKPLPGFPVKTGYRIYGGTALGDLDGDGRADIVVGGGDGKIYAFNGRGAPLPGWPVATRARIHSTPALADVDRDGALEVLVTSNDGRLHALNQRGRPVPGFPVMVGGELTTSPLAVDLDGDGSIEVLVASASGQLHAYSFVPSGAAKATSVAWAGYGNGPARHGRTFPNRGLFVELALAPEQARTADALEVHYRFVDLDGDAEKGTRIRWYREGKRVPDLDDSRKVPADATRKGQRWSYTLQAAEDFAVYAEGKGAHLARSPELRVANTPPSVPTVSHEPAQPGTRDDIKLVVTTPAQDADGDKVRYRVRWLRNRELVKELNDAFTLPATQTKKGQSWEAVVIAHDGADEGTPARHQVQIANSPPSAPGIVLAPATARADDRVTARVAKASIDADGDPIRYRYRWSVDGKRRPVDESVDTVPARSAGKGHLLGVDVLAFDGQVEGPATHVELKVANTAPPAPALSLVPAKPRAGDDLIVRIAPPRADADGDTIRYELAWRRNGEAVAGLREARVPAAQTRKGERWSAEVTAQDGEAAGPVAKAEVTVGNTPPAAPRVSISPAQPRAGDALKAQVVEPSTDLDGDSARYSWSWLRDGTEVAGLNTDSVPPGRLKKNEVWRVRSTPSDGTDSGTPGQADLRVEDTPPGAPVVRIEPAKPATADALRAVIATPAVDVDGDAISYRYTWFLDGVAQDLPADRAEVEPARTRKGQRWSVEATAVADGQIGEASRAEVEIGDTPPATPRVVIAPSNPHTGDALHASVPEFPQDVDGDPLSMAIRWLKDGQPAGIDGASVPAERTRRGERWTAEATANDGMRRSAPGKAEVRIANTPPRPPILKMTKRAWKTDETVIVQVVTPARDDDGDPVTLRYVWERDGKAVELPATTTQLTPERTAKGQAWVVRAIPRDDSEDGPEVRVAFTVLNTPPGPPTITLSPAKPSTREPLLVKIDAPAPDTDRDAQKYRYRWYKDGVRQRLDETSGRVDAKLTHRDEHWRVEVRAHDGEVEGPAASAELRIHNTAPEAPELRIEPDTPGGGQDLRCVVTREAQEADGDPLVYRFLWERDGAAVPEGVDGVVPGALVRKGQRWRCSAEASDGSLTGPRVQSSEVRVTNSPPAPPRIQVLPEQATADHPITCAVLDEALDPDMDPVRYRFAWLKGKAKKRLFEDQSVLPPGTARKGEQWTCLVRARDAEADSQEVQVSVSVINSPPASPRIHLEPEYPVAGVDGLRCIIDDQAMDPDGDKVRYRVQWFKDGVLQGFAATSLDVPSRLVVDKSLWQCAVEASDGKLNAELVRSNTVVVGRRQGDR